MTIKLELGQYYKTRDGIMAFVKEFINNGSLRPFIVEIDGDELSYTRNGQWLCGRTSEYDIIGPWEEKLITKDKVIKWAKEKGIAKPRNVYKQMLKMTEEVGELAGAIAKDKPDDIKMELGDCLVVLTILSEQLGIDMDECLDMAYNKISKRKGKTVNGIFIKEE